MREATAAHDPVVVDDRLVQAVTLAVEPIPHPAFDLLNALGAVFGLFPHLKGLALAE